MGEHQSRLRILVVEDDALMGMLLAEILVGLNYDVCGVVATQSEAVFAAARHRPDLMLVDVELAQGDGVSAMRAIQQTGRQPHIFMTGREVTDDVARAEFLRKPFSTADLVHAVRYACRDTR